MLLCIDGSYYVGLTHDLSRRIHDHSSGRGSTYTKGTKPTVLVWFESHPNREAAVSREKQIKGWNYSKKRAVAAGELRLGLSARNGWVSFV